MLGYFGPRGTLTHQALQSIEPDAEMLPYPSIADALDAVRESDVDASLVPIENSVEGSVAVTVDNLATGGSLMIIREVLYRMPIIASRVVGNPGAITRFVLVGPTGIPPARTGRDKTTVVAYMYRDRPGALVEILDQLASRGVNLCRIESRPTKAALGEYCFSIDADGHIADPRMREALKGLHRVCKKVVFLGSYERADSAQSKPALGFADADFYDADLWLENLDPTASTRDQDDGPRRAARPSP